jgi:hypothetical protein
MTGQDAGPRFILMALMALWLVLWGWSFLAFRLTPPEGDGFLRGMNRVLIFFGWQLAAALPAFAAWVVGRRWPKGSGTRWISRVPILLALGLAAIVGGLIGWASFSA